MARAASNQSGTMLVDKLSALGINVVLVKENTLNLDLPLKRIRSLEFSESGLVAQVVKGRDSSGLWVDLILIVQGRLITGRTEVVEKLRRKRAKPLDQRELFADETVIDLYLQSDEVGWRLSAGTFDFSCLGPEKEVTAFENFRRLIDMLQRHAPSATMDDAYHRLRPVLASVWPSGSETRKGNRRHSGIGTVEVSTVTVVNNEAQFNGYSRLRQRLKLIELEGRQ